MKARGKFLIGSGIIVATLLVLAYVGFTQSKTYYHTISNSPRCLLRRFISACSFRQCPRRVDFACWQPHQFCP